MSNVASKAPLVLLSLTEMSSLTSPDIQYMAAMIHPGGGRNDVPQRLKRHFVTLNVTIPTEEAIDQIFKTIANGHFNSSRGQKFS